MVAIRDGTAQSALGIAGRRAFPRHLVQRRKRTKVGVGVLGIIGTSGCAVLALGSFNVASAAPASLTAATTTARVTAISAGFEHSLALLDDGSVVAWGSNRMSQLGNGTTITASAPTAVCAPNVTSCPPGSPPSSYLRGVKAIAAGAFFSLALLDDNTLMAWGRAGDGSQGSLGIGRTRGNDCNGECQTVPVQVCAVGVTSCLPGSPSSAFLQGVTAIGVGTFFGLAVLSDSTVVAWGSNTSGQLGNAAIKKRIEEPVAVCAAGVKSCPPGSTPDKFLSGVTAVSGGDSFSLALKGHTAMAWGQNRYGQLGNGTVNGPDKCSTFACSQAPLAVKLKMPVSTVSAGNYHSVVIVDSPNGTPIGIESWGSDTEGQVGTGSKRGNACNGDCQTTPLAVPGDWNGLTAVSGGRSFSLALVGGRVVAWGVNHNPGRLGDGTRKSTSAPVAVCAVAVKACTMSSPASKVLQGVTAISAGGTVSLALLPKIVAVWGSNYRGSLGTASTAPGGTSFPLRVSGLIGRGE
jgi:alpha-tubulin suppressor-like RCC1 family protein